ncbi:carbohydrate ABC transporter permease [Microbacterium sp. CFBP9034]|uniref:carbohydrate ABC transporter permease n=1 Tax=Microbacterium sp. CFBP9034 TaxID=3096540 RepID=UPI002A6B15CF|nr:carbohydrate ABC transporter permease [Microbacterium sp. CFBP9034]MDY0908690.1 carbohydrate ABC transporter permease [Microbacterium sp. CFBP9034]
MAATAILPTGKTRTPRARGGMTKKRAIDWLLFIAVILGALVVMVPFYLILVNAFKSPVDYATSGPFALPQAIDFTGIQAFWERVNFPQKVWNSIFISGVVAVLAVVISLLNAFAIGIGRVRGRSWIVLLFLMANLLPQEALLYPLYYMFKSVGLYDNVWSVIIVFTVIQAAFGTYLLASVLGTFPKEVLEAASIDGATRWQILWRVVYPITRPTLSVLLIFFFIWTWNEFLIPLTFLPSNATQTVPVAVSVLTGDRLMDVTTTAGAALLSIIPTIIFFLIFQRTLTRGITAGAVK